jgi:tetratricopeptide (TPR) repeat protein
VQRAWAAYQAKHYDVAEREAQAALAVEPTDAEALSLLSFCSMVGNDRRTAIELGQQAIAQSPDEAVYHYRLAHIHSCFGDHKSAEPLLQTTISLDPAFTAAYALYGWVYLKRGHLDIALSAVHEALRIDPGHENALNIRIEILRAKKDLDGALCAAQDALAMHPENERAHAMLGVLELKRRNRGSAIAHLHESLRIDPDTAWVRQAYANAIEGRSIPARVFMHVSQGILRVFVQCSMILPIFGLGYLRSRQGYGVASEWHPALFGLVVVFHSLLILAWWGPLLSFFTLPRDSNVRRIVSSEFGLLERSRVGRLWQLLASAALLLSTASIFVAGDWIAPMACAIGGVAIAALMCTLAATPGTWLATRLCAAAVCITAIAWFVDPGALQPDQRASKSTLAKLFPISVIVSVAVIPLSKQSPRKN